TPGSLAAAGAALGRVLAVHPRAAQPLVVLRLDGAARLVGVPAHNLVRLSVLLGALLPPRRPARVGVHQLTPLPVLEPRLALAVSLLAHRQSREGGGAPVRSGQRLALVVADVP